MISQFSSVDALFSASYVENYLDCVENLPDDLQRNISFLRELDVTYQEVLKDLETYQQNLTEDIDGATRKKILVQLKNCLIRSQEIGDEKLQIGQQILDLIENKARQLDLDYKNLGVKPVLKEQENTEPVKLDLHPERSSKRPRRQRNETSTCQDISHERIEEKPIATTTKKSKKKKRRSKVEKERDDSPVDQPIDPDEPTYCLCQQISYGEMIGCDNERCSIEWFHFSCVGLTTKPKGKWYCPKCRGDRPNVMKPIKPTTSLTA